MTNVRNKRAGDVSGYTYRIPGKGGSVSEYSKETLRTDHKYFSNSFPVTFRAVYNTPKFMFQTHAGYTYDFMPALNAAGLQTIVHDGTRSDGGYSSVSNGKKHNFIWRGQRHSRSAVRIQPESELQDSRYSMAISIGCIQRRTISDLTIHIQKTMFHRISV